jgi:hypothetical protein
VTSLVTTASIADMPILVQRYWRSRTGFVTNMVVLHENIVPRLRTVLDSIAIAQAKALPYELYLQSDWWRARRLVALDRAGHRCQLCDKTTATQVDVHHRSYERLGAEREEDLIVLCRPCHARHHGR